MSALLAKARNNRESGFTLIELLTVIVIIGILAAIAIPVFTSQRQRAQDAASVSEARSTMTALESYAAGSAGGTVAVTATGTGAAATAVLSGTTDPAAALTGEGATFKTGDNLTTTVSFSSTGYTVVTTNTAGKATKSGSTSNPATFSQSGSYAGPSTAVNLVLG